MFPDNLTLDKPAIAGGTPAKTQPYATVQRYGDDELNELKEALAQNSLFYAHGKKVRQLEQDFAAKNGVPYAVTTSSGTASIHTAMMAAGISPGDEVIVAPITDMGSLVPILFQGGVPVFADLDPDTHVMTPQSVEAVITPKTKAVLTVHLWGNPCDVEGILALCDKRGIMVIEDCAQAFGATLNGKPVGTMGQIGCFSLNEFKHISCGDGGIVLTRDENLARRLRLSTDKCYNREPGAAMRNPFFLAANYRMTELQGAVAVAQLRKLDGIIAGRRRYAEGLSKALEGAPGIALPKPTAGSNPSWWFYMFRIDEATLGVNADKFAEAVAAEGVPASAHYIGRPVYEYPIFIDHSAFDHAPHPFAAREYKTGLCPKAEQILETAVRVNTHESYTTQDMEETARAIRRVATWFAASAR